MPKNRTKREDARIIKTRTKLFSAFTALLSEKPFEEITINEICDKAEVRRATFYKHFRDKYDFLRVLTSHLVSEFETQSSVQNIAVPDFCIAFVRRLIHFILDNEKAINLIIKSNMQTTLVDIIIKEVYKHIYSWLDYATKNGTKLISNTDIVATMLSGGISTIIIKWFTDDKRISPSELCAEIEILVKVMFDQ